MGRRNWRIGREKEKRKRSGENFPIFPFRKKKRLATCLITDLLQAKECSCLQSNTPRFPKRAMKKKFLFKSSIANCSPLSPINTWSDIFLLPPFSRNMKKLMRETTVGRQQLLFPPQFSSCLDMKPSGRRRIEEGKREGSKSLIPMISRRLSGIAPPLFHPPQRRNQLAPFPLSI